MDFYTYLKAFEKTTQEELTCSCCASIVLTPDGKDSVCPFCEQLVSGISPRETKETKTLAAIQKLIDKNIWDKAAESVDSFIENSTDPYKLFFAANFYKSYSDYRYYKRNYALPGFMEDNSTNVYASLDLISKAKEYFYKTIKLGSDKVKYSNDQTMIYTRFISYIKLDRPVQASMALRELMELTGPDLSKDYSNMVYNVTIGNSGAEQFLNSLVMKQLPNAFYYLSLQLIRKKRLKDAENVLDRLTKKIRMPMAYYLLNKVRELQEETSL